MKILGSDYDGTLNCDGFPKEKFEAIQKWRERGHKLGAVSGRGPSLMDFLQKEFGLSLDFLVAFNGGLILNAQQKYIHESVCREVDLTDLTKDLFAWGCKFAHVNSDKYYLVKRDNNFEHENAVTLDEITLLPLIYQVSVEMESVEEASRIVKLCAEKYGKHLSPLQNGICVDIVPMGVNKAVGMYKVMEYYNAEWKDVIVAGDNLNDIDMLKEFHSYAIESGLDEIKTISTHTVKSIMELIETELQAEDGR